MSDPFLKQSGHTILANNCPDSGQHCALSVKSSEKKNTGAQHQVGVPTPHSPDQNLIEFLWKSIKRIVSKTLIASEMHLKAVIESTFEEISMFNSYSMGWIRKFIPKVYNTYQMLGIKL